MPHATRWSSSARRETRIIATSPTRNDRPRAVELDACGSHGDDLARLAHPRQLDDVRSAASPQKDVLECSALPLVRTFVDVQDDRPRRSRFIVVVAVRERDAESREVEVVRVSCVDAPTEEPEAHAV